MDIPLRRGNIFSLLEDEEAEEAPAPKQKTNKNAAPAPSSVKTDPKASKPKPAEKRPAKAPERQADEAAVFQGKEKRNEKRTERPGNDDRKSRTGRGREMKKGGGGSHNWGKPEDDSKVQPEAPWAGEEKKEEGTETKAEGEDTAPVEEKKPDFITLSDYYRQKANPDEEEEQEKSENEEDKGGLLRFKVKVEDNRRGRGRGRGDRGGYEGKRGGGNFRGKEKQEKSAPNPLDFGAFPSLV